MPLRRVFASCVLLLCLTSSGSAQIDLSIVPVANRTVWKPGVQGIPVRTTVCATVQASTYGNGSQNATQGIQAAINSCPAGQIVRLSAGTFTVNDLVSINKGITLRGAGPNATILQKTNGAIFGQGNQNLADYSPILLVGPSRFPHVNDSSAVNLTANGVKGATSITVASASGFASGQIVLLDADDYNAGAWTPLPNRNGAPTSATIWASDRAVWQRHNPPDPAHDDGFPDSLTYFSRMYRPIAEVKEIASVSGNTITFTTPLHIDYPTSKTAQLTRYDEVHVRNAGIEEMKVIGGSSGNIRFECVSYSWVRNVEDTVWVGEGISINSSFRIEIRDSYVHDAAASNPGGVAYAIGLSTGTAEVLVENNIVMKSNKVIVARSAGAGSVVGYNYMDDGFISYQPDWVEVGLNASHGVGSHHVLFEGNESFNYDSDNEHGNAIYMTVFRNHLSGFRRSFTGMGNGRAAGLNYGSWWHSFIGNVLGIDGRMGGWIYEQLGTHAPDDPFGGSPAIWKFGYQNAVWEQAADPKVLSTVLRDGNFDFLTNTVRWDRPAQALPPSLYLTAKPAFFGNNPWPWVNPTDAVKLGVLPARQRYDSGQTGVPAGTTPPARPEALRIVK